MKRFLVCVFLLVLVLGEVVMCCEGCLKQERQALIALNSQLGNSLSWGDNTNTADCCKWDGVECNTTNGRIAKLKFPYVGPWQLNYSDFIIFKDLKSLDLSYTQISNCTKTDQGLKNLEVLDLSYNYYLDNATSILSCLDGLSSLKSLSLAGINDNASLHIFQTILETISSKMLHLEVLDISSNYLTNEILPSLRGFTTLKELDLTDIGLDSDLHFQGLKNLEILDISLNNFNDTDIASALSGLSSLKSLFLQESEITERSIHNISKLSSLGILDLSDNNLNGSLDIVDWSKLIKLEELDLSSNEFAGKLPSSFVNMTSLRTLTLSNNHLTGNISPHLSSFNSLEYLNFEENQFEFPISLTQFSNHSNLKFIYGNGNKVILDSPSTLKKWVPKFQLQVLQLSSINQSNSIPPPNFLLYQYNLIDVDFSGCKLRGEYPNWLVENNTKMESLTLETCSFIGDFQIPSRSHLNMKKIDVSNNAITGMLNNNISSTFPNLNHLNMSGNAIHGSIPYELSLISSLSSLDLSDNQLSGLIPHNISGYDGQLTILSLSNNKLHGPVPLMLSMFNSLQSLFIDGNSLSGSIPSNFFNSSIIQNLDISDNNFIGKIPGQIKNNSVQLVELSMSFNHFEGYIPSELTQLEELNYLDLSQNKFVGCVPSFVNSSAVSIHLSNNNLSCLSKNLFGESSFLATLDLSNNAIVSGFHDLIHDLQYTGLTILLLKDNHFEGNIPKQLCNLTYLNLLDLSWNRFVGEIPNCINKMPFENNDPQLLWSQLNGDFGQEIRRHGKERDSFTSKRRSENYTTNILIYMSGIDLSHNKLNGSIPSELGNLTKIRSLNLSNNFFTGKIPATFSNLVQVESLDLSFNMLSGRIPPQLSVLTSLEVFSVAHNNLSGATPEWKGQFSTFDESSYEGNQFLCGPPLPKIAMYLHYQMD